MGSSLPWEKSIMEMSAVEILINNAREHAANNNWNEDMEEDGENIENEEFQLVYENSALIRSIYSNGALNIPDPKIADVILRLLDTLTDFTSDLSLIRKETKDLEGARELEFHSESQNNSKVLDGASKLLFDKFQQKFLPRFKQLNSMRFYHIRSYLRLTKMISEGDIEPGTISPLPFNFYIIAFSAINTQLEIITLNIGDYLSAVRSFQRSVECLCNENECNKPVPVAFE